MLTRFFYHADPSSGDHEKRADHAADADADGDHADADADQTGRASSSEMRPILADEGHGDLRGDVRHAH